MTPHWADVFRTWVYLGCGLVVLVVAFAWFKYLPRFMGQLRDGERALRDAREARETAPEGVTEATVKRTTGARRIP